MELRDGVDWDLVRKVEVTESEYLRAKGRLSDHLLGLSPFKKGDVVRDKDSGARYRIDSGSGHLINGRPSLMLQGTRVYSTGRRPASSSSWLDSKNLEKVEQ